MKSKLLILIGLGLMLLNACSLGMATTPTPDVAFLYTAAAQTVMADITRTASAFTPTLEANATPGLALTVPAQSPTLTVESTLNVDALSTPTVQPLPGLGASSTPVLCDASSFDNGSVDVNIPDDTQMSPGQDFIKTWRIKNVGTCIWGQGYRLVYGGYNVKMNGQPQPLPKVVNPGEETEVSVQFKAPSQPGVYVSAWRMANDKGVPFGKPLYVKIAVR